MQFVVNGIAQGACYCLVAVGLGVIMLSTRFFPFAHGVVYAAGAYFAYSLSISLGINPILSFFLPPSFQLSSA